MSVRSKKLKMKLRAAYEEFSPKDELRKTTLQTMNSVLKMWERLTPNPCVSDVTNETVAEFRSACLARPYKPRTINGAWSFCRSIFRRLGPVIHGNPWGLSLLTEIPAMRPVREAHRRPYRIPLDDMAATYIAAEHAQYPRVVPAPDWWRALLVISYTTALRRGDLFSLRWSQVDFDALTMDFTARKTGKADVWPLHPVAVDHLRRLNPGNRDGVVFAGHRGFGSVFYRRFRDLQEEAGVKRHFTLHDIRRTAASEIERVKSGLAPELLQHAPRNVTEKFYLNQFEELSDALQQMRLAKGFKDGPKKAERELAKARRARARQQAQNPQWSTKPPASDWSFHPGGFTFRGDRYRLEYASRLRLLKLLATSEHAVTWQDAAEVLGNPQGGESLKRVHVHVSGLRKDLREMFGLPDGCNPIHCVSRGEGGAWTISIP